MQMEKAYNPAAIENRWYERWETTGAFAPAGEGKAYSITIPPPNVTGILHMGHALDHTLEDIRVILGFLQKVNVLVSEVSPVLHASVLLTDS